MKYRHSLLLPLLLTSCAALCQTATIPAGTPLSVQIDDHLPMRVGQPIRAELIYPVYADNKLILPEKTLLEGTVTALRSDHSRRLTARLRADFTPFYIPVVRFTARRFGRVGVLHFDFRQLVLPSGKTQNVQAAVTSADSSAAQNLAMDSEGQVKPKPQDKVIVPLILIALAASPLHQDRDDGDRELFRKNAGASNSIGLIGFIVGTASGSANVAAGFGAYGAALSLYNRWIKRGGEVSFARDTRIVVQTTARRSQVLKPNLPATSN